MDLGKKEEKKTWKSKIQDADDSLPGLISDQTLTNILLKNVLKILRVTNCFSNCINITRFTENFPNIFREKANSPERHLHEYKRSSRN